jgi:(p)ppGpp synthase/HD superfamily hydrolase
VAISPLDRALRLATRLHTGETRDGDAPLPYCTHPVEVVLHLRHVGGVTDSDLLVAAALHDTVEEGLISFDQISARFGPVVSELVRELTRYEPTSAETAGLSRNEIWTLRSETMLAEIAAMSPAARQIKLADRLSNLDEGLRTKTGQRLRRYLGQTRRILDIIPEATNPGLWRAIYHRLPKKPERLTADRDQIRRESGDSQKKLKNRLA